MGNSIGLTPESGDFGTAWSLSRLHADAGSELYLGASLYNTSTAPVQLFNSSGNVSAQIAYGTTHKTRWVYPAWYYNVTQEIPVGSGGKTA